MKLTKVFFALLLVLLLFTKTSSQDLQIGQSVPDYTIRNILNYKSDQINLKDFRGKLLVFDFWYFGCTPCLKRFNEIDSLQKKYDSKIQMFLVNKDNIQQTKKFFATHTKLKQPEKIPFITNDTLLNNIFPHEGVPFYVLIDSTGRLSYETYEHITGDTIAKYLSGKKLELFKTPDAKYVASLFDKNFETSIQYATYIFKDADSFNLRIDYNNDNICTESRSIQDLYQFAYNDSDNDAFYKFREPGRTVLEVSNIAKYKYITGTNYDQWRSLYGYYYHSILPKWLEKDKYKIMQEDLHRYFDLDVKIEKRKVRCLALVRTSSHDKLISKGGNPFQTAFTIEFKLKDNDPLNAPIRFIRNKPFKSLFDMIEGYGNWQFNTKIVDSTNYTGNIDFEMKEDEVKDLTVEKLRKALQRYDLDLIEKFITMDVLILSEKHNTDGSK